MKQGWISSPLTSQTSLPPPKLSFGYLLDVPFRFLKLKLSEPTLVTLPQIQPSFCVPLFSKLGFPGGMRGNEPACRRHKRHGRSLGCEDLEDGMATHSSILARRIPMDREAWWATVHGVTKCWTILKQLSTHACILVNYQLPSPKILLPS